MSGIVHTQTSTKPGHVTHSPAGIRCDDHPDRIAKYRLQGETSSEKYHYNDFCSECYSKFEKLFQ